MVKFSETDQIPSRYGLDELPADITRRELLYFFWPSDSNRTISYAKLFPIRLSQWPQALPIEFLFNVETDLSMHVYAGELGWPLV